MRGQRLSKGAAFDTAFREGVAQSGPLLVVRVRPHTGDEGAGATARIRWGFAVGKKMAPHAVDRNRLKRQLREAARSLAPEVATGLDIIVIARPAARGKRFWALRDALRAQLARAGAITSDVQRPERGPNA